MMDRTGSRLKRARRVVRGVETLTNGFYSACLACDGLSRQWIVQYREQLASGRAGVASSLNSLLKDGMAFALVAN